MELKTPIHIVKYNGQSLCSIFFLEISFLCSSAANEIECIVDGWVEHNPPLPTHHLGNHFCVFPVLDSPVSWISSFPSLVCISILC